jgi:hypothetical protein
MGKDVNFHPNFKDMQPSDYAYRTVTLPKKRAKAFHSKTYRDRHPDKITAYEVNHPVLSLRVSPGMMDFLRAQPEPPQNLVRRLIQEYQRSVQPDFL